VVSTAYSWPALPSLPIANRPYANKRYREANKEEALGGHDLCEYRAGTQTVKGLAPGLRKHLWARGLPRICNKRMMRAINRERAM
jgi:hypothetical protein